MGNSSSSHHRRNGHGHNHSSSHPALPAVPPHPPTHPGATPQPTVAPPPTNRYVFAAASPYPNPNNPNPSHPYYPHPQFQPQYGYYPPPPLPAPYDTRGPQPPHMQFGWGGPGAARWAPPVPVPVPSPNPAPYVEHQKAVTIRNDVNIKKETLKIEPDENEPEKYLVSFTFDSTVAGSITIYFFAKEGVECNLTSTKDSSLSPPPFTFTFKEGLGQKFFQPSGTGIRLSSFPDSDLSKIPKQLDICPLAVKADAYQPIQEPNQENQEPNQENQENKEHQENKEDQESQENQEDKEHKQESTNNKRGSNSQITQAVFERREKGGYGVRVVKQILWVNETRYELQEIYGIGNSVEGENDANDPGKECVICLSEPRDTTVLPCRHMCMCSECAKVLRFQSNRCPICRQPVERLLEIRVNNNNKGDEMNKQEG